MPSDFVHLHTHYSLLKSTNTCSGLLDMAQKYDMPAVAVTDYNTLAGVMDMYNVFAQTAINPIIGCEVYIKNQPCNLVLLAKDIKGYHNLCAIISEANIKEMHINRELL
ncbi:MAG: PHP domain-containing protein, partial [Victivallaceae bacterium]|nr:PHP domain-containing protein [Victivallaceae bacterium]